MELTTTAFTDGGRIPPEYAFCVPDPDAGADLGPNRSPAFSWSGVPDGARSLAFVCFDRSAPEKAAVDAAGDESIPHGTPRPGFYHLVLVDIDPTRSGFHEGELSDGVVAQGKPAPDETGYRSGRNDYTAWFDGDDAMGGTYHLYDGPCPPPNDSIVHEYVFTLYALDTERLDVDGSFSGQDAVAAMEGLILAEASVTGTYSLNPSLA